MRTVFHFLQHPKSVPKASPTIQYFLKAALDLISANDPWKSNSMIIRAANTLLHPLSQNKMYPQPLNKQSKALTCIYHCFTNSQTTAEVKSFVFCMTF